MLYTGKGDDGTTKTFGALKNTQGAHALKKGRISKASLVVWALGSLDEVNSFLGLCKVEAAERGVSVPSPRVQKVSTIVHRLQQDLFIIQAEVAGAGKKVSAAKVARLEALIGTIERELPPITTFFISGGSRLAALFDSARTLARRAERVVVEMHEEGEHTVGVQTLRYLNRLSSVLYALARFANVHEGVKEEAPNYK